MADRRDYYFRQKVTEAELDEGFNGLEVADFNLTVDHNLIGVVEGMVVTEKSGTPDLSVDVSGPGATYSKAGERIAFSSLQNVDVSVDDSAVSTAVVTPGNARIVSVFVLFDRLLSDPRIDGNSLTVFFDRDESFDFSVVAGAEATSGSEVPPALDSGKILLGDVTLIFGQTQVFNADIDVATLSRREDAFAFRGGTVEIVGGNSPDAVSDLLDALNAHIDATANKHPAADVTYAGSPNWESGNPLTGPPTNVEAAVDAVVSDLARLTGGIGSGAAQVGIDALPAWHDAVTQPATDIFARLTAMVNALIATSGKGGGDKLGLGALQAWHDTTNVAAGSIHDVVDAIVAALASVAGNGGGDKVGLAAQSSGAEAVGVGSIFDQIGDLLDSLANKATGFLQFMPTIVAPTATGATAEAMAFGGTGTPQRYAIHTDVAGQVFDSESGPASWTSHAIGSIGGGVHPECMIFSSIASLFIVVGNAGTIDIATSPDGLTWTGRTDPRASSTRYALAEGASIIVNAASSASGFISSPDGITWTTRAYPGGWTGTARSLAFGASLFMALSSNGESATSADGITWTNRGALATANDYGFLIYEPVSATWIACMTTVGPSRIEISQNDGVSWTDKGDPVSGAWGAAFFVLDGDVLADGTVVLLVDVGDTDTFGILVNDPTAGDPYLPASWTFHTFGGFVDSPKFLKIINNRIFVGGTIAGGTDPVVVQGGLVL